MPCLLVMAGGTGGHIYPGLAVADVLREQGWQVVWLGNPSGMEATLVPKHGYPIEYLNFGALRGKGLLRKLLLPLNLLRGFWQAVQVLRKIKPNVVLGMGGYVTFPGGMMASLLNIPLVLHEQNSIAGLANRVLAKVADKVASGFPKALPNAQWVGNPVRADIVALPEPAQRMAERMGESPLRILVVGGSRGAQILNSIVPQALALIPQQQRPQVVHQAGSGQLDNLRTAYQQAGVEGDLRMYLDDMAAEYAQADVVVCRSGALTVAELCAAGVASILVPFPSAVDDHQTHNARFLADAGAAKLIPQPQFSPAGLAELLRELDRNKLLAMAQAARGLVKAQAAAEVAAICTDIAR